MQESTLFKRLKALILFRAFFVTLLLGTSFVFEVGYQKFPYLHALPHFIVTLYVVSVIYGIMLSKLRDLRAFAYLQLVTDTAASVVLVVLTGGIESWFSSVMLLVVITYVIVLHKQAGFIAATLCSIFYGTVLDLQFYGVLPAAFDVATRQKDFFYNIFSHITALYLTAYLAGYLSSRLEKTSKRLEEKDIDLKDLTIFNRELIESLPSGLLTTDLSGNIILFNRAAESILGMSRSAVEGKPIVHLFPFLQFPFTTERKDGKIFRNGAARTIGLTISGSMDSSGQKTGYICIFQDITDLKNLEAELKHKETLAAIGELSANMAHEIRNPLASLKGSIEMLKEGRLTKDHGEKLMDIAVSEMDRLDKIITDFLTYSRPKKPELSTFDLHAVLDETVELMRNAMVNTDTITIRRDFGGRNQILADPLKLRQVFLNLGINAIESMPDGGTLTIATRKTLDSVRIIVEDTGIGIPPEHQKEIFYPFFTTKDRGTGLGLSIAYRIIEEHHGRMTVRSSPGKGTTFEIVLPLAPGSGVTHDATAVLGRP